MVDDIQSSVEDGLLHLSCEEAASPEKSYILHMHGSEEQNKIGIGLSDKTVSVHDLTYLKKLRDCGKHNDPISGVRFSPCDSNILYSSSMDGKLKVWDIRVDDYVNEFKDDSEGTLKPLTSFDVSCNGQIVCAGTEMFEGDSFLLFWDIRTSKLCGGYFDSHANDITQVKYHPVEADTLISGSTDGIINIFDTKKATEDDALQSCLNTESSVDKINWMKSTSKWDFVSCVTDTSDVQLWNIEGTAPELSFSRKAIANALKCDSEDDVFIVDVFQKFQQLSNVVLAHFTSETGTPLVLLDADNDLKPITTLNANKQIVRCSWYCTKNDMLVTGGESGILSTWKQGEGETFTSVKSNLKAPSKRLKKGNSKPY